MFKIISTVMLGLSLVFNNVYEDKTILKDEMIVKEIDGIKLSLDCDNYIVTNGKDRVLISNMINVDISVVNDYVIILEEMYGNVILTKYDKKMKLVKMVEYENSYYNPKLITFNNNTYLITGVDQVRNIEGIADFSLSLAYANNSLGKMDIAICKIKEDLTIAFSKVYGGYLNDYFIDCKCNNNYIAITGKKDYCSGGTFGNGGEDLANIIAIFDKNLDVVNYCVTSNDIEGRIQDFMIFDDSYSFLTSDSFYTYDFQNNEILSLKLPFCCCFGRVLSSYSFLCYDKDTLKLYDAIMNDVLYSIASFKDCTFYNYKYIYYIDNGFCKLDLYDLSNYSKEKDYDIKDNPSIIDTIYGYYNYKETVFDKNFDSSVSGRYEAINYYEKDEDIVAIKQDIIVQEKENVSEGYIYPFGYNLFFTGIGYLNGRLITQNYPVITTGSNNLRLISNDGSERSINFMIEKGQVAINEDMNKKYDYFGQVGDLVKISFTLDGINDKDIKGVFFDGKYQDYSIEDNILYVDVLIEEKGIKKYNLSFIEYEYEGKTYCIYINKYLYILGIKDDLYIDCYLNDNEKDATVNVVLFDETCSSRFIEIVITNNNYEKSYLYSFANNNYVINDLIIGKEYEYALNVLFYNGTKTLDRHKLLEGRIIAKDEEFLLGYSDVLEKVEGMVKLNLVIKKGKNMNTLSFFDRTISMKNNTIKKGAYIAMPFGAIFDVALIILRKKKIIFK